MSLRSTLGSITMRRSLLQRVAYGMSAMGAHIGMRVFMKRLVFDGVDRLVHTIETRRQPLVTIANHLSVFDEPLMWGAAMPLRLLMRPHLMRYSMAAEEILFPNPLYAWYGHAAGAIPVMRGNGIDQRGVDVALNVLNEGGWIHIFSEGKINQADTLLSPFRWGVGKLVAECAQEPIVVPIFMRGLQFAFPEDGVSSRLPRLGHDFLLSVGEPLTGVADLREQAHAASGRKPLSRLIDVNPASWRSTPTGDAERAVYSIITARIESALLAVQKQTMERNAH
jgi:1-acyl-sn-glycerol-3-phosphate acyltransferase